MSARKTKMQGGPGQCGKHLPFPELSYLFLVCPASMKHEHRDIQMSHSKLGDIRLGRQDEKPEFGFWLWGAMVFTCGLAADILFYSLCEWIYYAQEPHVQQMGELYEWTHTYSLFHWGPIPWGFYAVLAAAFGFMI
ncbi:MAG: BCCT family transporter [Solobacterium sp.]|nr:BCCT family transporter [Solobacterium sp.]